MLASRHTHTTLPAANLERAKRFYADKLGLTPEQETPGGVFYHTGGDTRLLVYPSQGVASGTHTQIGWTVDDIEAEVADLKARGVVFEEYPTTVNSIASPGPIKAAWFKDSEGNLHGLVQFL